ncbi:MAG: alpha/beta hydrolase [Lachnospiraceae bacterium]|nr:alpha/beta hydrolase [Lachnospiraceae bacterium]
MQNGTMEQMKVYHHDRHVNGHFYAPAESGKYPVVIFSHGYNGNKMDFDLSAKYLVEHKVAAFCYDFCGGSNRDESGMATTDMTLFTEMEDLKAVIEQVKALEKVDEDKVFLFGGSQGGLVTALTADSMSEEIRGMILLYPAFCIADNWNERFPNKEDIPEEEELWGMKLGRVFFESIHGYDVFEHVGQYCRNILVMHGDQDPIVSLGYSERIKATYENVRLEVFEGEGHGFTPEGNETMTRMLLEFVKANI